MTSAQSYRVQAIVGSDHRIEIVAPNLSEGDQVEVILLPASKVEPEPRRSIADLILDPNRPMRDAAYWEMREREMREERDAWDR